MQAERLEHLVTPLREAVMEGLAHLRVVGLHARPVELGQTVVLLAPVEVAQAVVGVVLRLRLALLLGLGRELLGLGCELLGLGRELLVLRRP